VRSNAQSEERPLPHDKDAEVFVLGAVIRDARNFRKASRLVSAGDFFFEEHGIAYQALSRLSSESKPTDDASLIACLSDCGLLSKAGGPAYVAQLADGVHDQFDVTIPARRVHELSLLRQIATRANLTEQAALKPGATPREVLNSGIDGLRLLVSQSSGTGSLCSPGNGAEILCEVERFIRRFVSLSPAQAGITALWAAHSHAFTAATTTPYLHINSAEKQSGKTRLLEVLELLTANPWLTGRTSPAALSRKIDGEAPTLLLDESDAAFGGDKEYTEVLRGILNTGHRLGGKTSVCVGQGKDISVRDFSTFCPKAIAGLGKLPDTVADRSIPIVLKRATSGEIPERFRRRAVEGEATELRDRLAQWAGGIFDALDKVEPFLPESLSDRQQDGAEPLLAIADAAGGDWPYNARQSLVSLFGRAEHAESIGTRLLADIRAVFDEVKTDKISSHSLVEALVAIETAPWSEWSHGKPITPARLSRLLRPFDIGPHNIKIKTTEGKDQVPKGYELADFEDSWRRYLSLPSSENATSLPAAPDAAILQIPSATGDDMVAAQDEQKAAKNGPRSGVALFERDREADWQLEGLGVS
jgi:hypothetical protein